MSIESVRAFFAEHAPDITVIESPLSSATVTLAAEAYGVTGLPSFVLIGADGTVVARLAGEPSAQDMASLIAALPAP